MISFNHKIYHHFKKLNEKNEKKMQGKFCLFRNESFFFLCRFNFRKTLLIK